MSRSDTLFNEAQSVIPGGVNSPVRAFAGVGGTPVYFKRAQGAYVYDADDNQYIDYVASWGPMILGHAHPHVIKAVQEKAEDGLSFGAPTEIETEIANKVVELVPSIEMVRSQYCTPYLDNILNPSSSHAPGTRKTATVSAGAFSISKIPFTIPRATRSTRVLLTTFMITAIFFMFELESISLVNSLTFRTEGLPPISQ